MERSYWLESAFWEMYDIQFLHMGRPMFLIMLEKSYFNRDQGSGQDFSGFEYPIGGIWSL